MKKPKIPSKMPRLTKRRQAAEERVKEAFANVPRITNETVAEHREDVLAGARKYIYPLKHSRRRAVIISGSIFITALIVFLSYVTISLYKFQSTSGFLYGVTKVIPYPVAKAGPSWVSYNSYLFELRHYTHYYASQQGVDFRSDSGKQQLNNFKKQALDQVINDAYVKQLAKKHHVRVSQRVVTDQVALVRSQNRLGSSEREFEEVLNEFWGWNQNDFKRELQQELLAQAVVAKLDTTTNQRAAEILKQVQAGTDFATVAGQASDDAATKASGGQYAAPVARNDANVPAQVVIELFKLKAGQTSGIINSGYALDILKLNTVQDGKLQASHIQFNYKPISDYVKPLKAQQPPHDYIKV